jgi:hypothetical protein
MTTVTDYENFAPQLPLGSWTTGEFIREYIGKHLGEILYDGAILSKEDRVKFISELTTHDKFIVCRGDNEVFFHYVWTDNGKIEFATNRIRIFTN